MRLVSLLIVALMTAKSFAAPPQPPDLLWNKLENRIAELIARADGVMGIAILDLTDGRTLERNADQVFPAASSIKLAILLELYRQDQAAHGGTKGKAKLD